MGIGRNEYIELMNRSKTGKGIFRKRVAPKLLLPTEPVSRQRGRPLLYLPRHMF